MKEEISGLECCDISFIYPDEKFASPEEKEEAYIFKDASFSCPSHGLVLIKGDNGAGKTTLFKILLGFVDVTKGDFHINESNIIGYSSAGADDVDPYVSCKYFLSSYLEENEIEKKLEQLKLKKQKKHRIFELSSGQKKKLSLSRAFNLPGAKYIFLDEPLSHLDQDFQELIRKKIKNDKDKKLILIVTHEKSFDAIADKIYKIDKKTIIEI